MRTLLALLAFIPAVTVSQEYVPVSIPTRDGKSLAADLYSGDTTVRRPTILIQTPYNKNRYRVAVDLGLSGGALPYDSAHYNYVIVDWRGFHGSTDAAIPGYDRGLDGYDAVEWIAVQPWSDGKIGTWGGSALGAIQFQTARHHPPHLVCAVPMIKDFKTKYEDNYYGGVFRREHVETVAQLGLTNVDIVLEHPTNDITWQLLEAASDHPEEYTVPMLLVSGWFDHFPDDVLRAFDDLRTRSATQVRNDHRLIMGPWLHAEVDAARQGELSFSNAVGVANDAALRFFDFWLRNANNTWRSQPVVYYYQMGENKWRSADAWEDVAVRLDTLYLAAGGVLASTVPHVDGVDSYRYDPRDPSPAVGGSRFYFPGSVIPPSQGPKDQGPLVESRSDLLIYTTEVLASPLVIDGGVTVALACSSDRYDTDVSVRLCDVYPDGRSMLITQGIRRLRFRNGSRPSDTASVPSGQTVWATVALQNTAITIPPGHRLRIDVASSCWPHFDLNPNTGGPLYQAGGDTLVAMNSIHHGPSYPSRVVLPIGSGSSSVHDALFTRASMSIVPQPLSHTGRVRVVGNRSGAYRLVIMTIYGEETGVSLAGTVGDHDASDITIDVASLGVGIYIVSGTIAGSPVMSMMRVVR